MSHSNSPKSSHQKSSRQKSSRRDFLKRSSFLAAAAGTSPYWFSTMPSAEANFATPNERPVIGCIGTGDRWGQVIPGGMRFGDVAAVCDVDSTHVAKAKEKVLSKRAKGDDRCVDTYENYSRILDRKDIDLVTIVTTDHWHSKIAIEAMKAGKDVYCEKPLTLTIEEGKQIRKVQEETGRVFQVGTQQRTDMGRRFLTAVAMVQNGRIGKVKKVTCDIGGVAPSGAIPVAPIPKGLNWELWLGQAPLADFRFKDNKSRWGLTNGQYNFRWWYEYSGGKMTDWGAHHVDIAQWAIQQNGEGQGPTHLSGTAVHPVPLKDGMPTLPDQYNVAKSFDVKVQFANGIEMKIVSNSPDNNGILFEGDKGRFHVSRRRMKGAPAEALKKNPITQEQLEAVYGDKLPGSHMENFMNCVKSRKTPISDVKSHHRALTTCHLANIAIRLGRDIKWDPKTEQIIGDEQANAFQSREQRKGYEIKT